MNTSHPVAEDFLRLTKYTCPHGWEATMYGDDLLAIGANMDEHGNFLLEIPGNEYVLFTSHMDTASMEDRPLRVKRRTLPGGVLGARNSILGADDKAGMAIMLHMIRHEIPGTYAFFVGEERGCVGSSAYAHRLDKVFHQVVSFDRFGTNSIITHQLLGRSASDEYALALANEFRKVGVDGLAPDPGGSYTDSAQFMDIAYECTNISVGYYNQHTANEVQDVGFLTLMADAVLQIPWGDLPIVRQPGEDDWDTQYDLARMWGGGKTTGTKYNGYVWGGDYEDYPTYGKRVRSLTSEAILHGDIMPDLDELREFAHNDPDDAAVVIDALLYERYHVFS